MPNFSQIDEEVADESSKVRLSNLSDLLNSTTFVVHKKNCSVKNRILVECFNTNFSREWGAGI